MPKFKLIVLYVEDPAVSATFYSRLLEKPIAEQSPGFAMLPLADDVMLGLWKRDAVQPEAGPASTGSEIAFAVDGADDVEAMFRHWSEQWVAIAQTPTRMDFGMTFVGEDPDGHRLRVLTAA